MKKARFRIHRITVEGFRGFTTPQHIPSDGQNLFVFGPNGRGKSSIIEAVRWCLFGSQSGKEIEVRNAFYEEGDCVVTLLLSGSDGQLELKRELRPGTDRSRLSIRNAAGQELSLQAALPQLARIGHEQGTQVIFAAQQSAGRHAQVDITDFTRVLCFYLGLEDAPELAKELFRLVEERNTQADEMAKELETVEALYRTQVTDLQTKLGVLLSNPPWGDGPAPTGDQTDTRIHSFLEEQARVYGLQVPVVRGRAALDQLRRWIDSTESKRVDTLQSRLQALTEQLGRARSHFTEMKSAMNKVAAAQVQMREAQAQLTKLLDGKAEGDLAEQLERQEESMTERQTRFEIARRAETLCGDHVPQVCPLCTAQVDPAVFRSMIASHISDGKDLAEQGHQLDRLRGTVREVQSVRNALGDASKLLAEAQDEEAAARASLCSVVNLDSSSQEANRLEQEIERLARDVENVSRSISAATVDRQQKIKRLKDLTAELSYHDYRDALDQALQSLASGLKPAQEVLAEYRELLGSTAKIQQMVDDAFNATLDRATPPLNQMMTEAFTRLTHHPSYDQVLISRTQERRRELRVASSRRPGKPYSSTVLNGQAFKALQLVPYFVFSRFQPEIMELDLLLIDDPSESFDTSHVESLVAELADAARHAQLVVATHEREKFEGHLSHFFSQEPYKVASVEAFDALGGPTIVYR